MAENANSKQSKSVLFEMLRSFSTLARTLNLSKTVEILGVSRQTVRRHLNDLEELRGETLLEFNERKYRLTEDGQQALLEAEILLQKAELWVSKESGSVNGLLKVSVDLDGKTPFHAQRQPLARIWKSAPPLIQEGLRAWCASDFLLEAPALQKVRPYLIVYRKNRGDWICTEVGEVSSYATWLGWSWAKSAIGASFESDPLGNTADTFILEAYETVIRSGSVWYDHISTRLLRDDMEKTVPVHYQRLVFCCLFPNGEPAVASLVARTNMIEIDGLADDAFEPMPESDLMEFSL